MENANFAGAAGVSILPQQEHLAPQASTKADIFPGHGQNEVR